MRNIVRGVINLYWHWFKSPAEYARHIGVQMGEDIFCGWNWWSSEPYLISVGNHVQITHEVKIFTHGGAHVVRQYCEDFDVFGRVIIEDDVYIGTYSMIMPGVTIGKGSLVAAGSVVTKSTPPRCVVAGNPARFICTVEEFVRKNMPYNIGTYGMSPKEKRAFIERLAESRFIKKSQIKVPAEQK